MYSVWFIDGGGKNIAINANSNRPLAFEDPNDGWDFIQLFMNSEQRPRLMWLQEVPDADLGQFDYLPAHRGELYERHGDR